MSPLRPAAASGPAPAGHRPGTRPRPWDRTEPSGGHARQPQGPHEGGGLTGAVGHAAPQPLASQGAAMAAGHLGRGAGLVDEHQPFRI